MPSTVFNSGGVKLLKSILRFKNSDVQIITDNSADPTVTAVDAVAGSIYIRTTGQVYIKNTSGNNTDFRIVASQAELNAHINNPTDAHDASAISNIPVGNLSAVNVQSALDELQADVDTRALDSIVIKKDGSVTFTANQSLGGFKLTNSTDPVSSQDLVTLAYMNARLNGLTPKAPVRVATLIAGTLATSFESGDVIDGITLSTNDRILIKNQAAPSENGIYIVNVTGAPTRSQDMDSTTPFDEFNGAWVAIQEGSQTGQVFVQYGVVTVVNTDPVNFQFYNPIAGLIGGDMITFAGSTFSVDLATVSGLESSNPANVAGQLRIKLEATNPSLQMAISNQLGLKMGSNSALGKFSDGVNVQVDNSTTEIISNFIQVKDAGITNAKIASGIDAVKLSSGAVSNTEFDYLDGVTSPIQTQLNNSATIALDNLSTTSINADLLPIVNNVVNVGTSALKWQNVWIDTAAKSPTYDIVASGAGNAFVSGSFKAINGAESPDGIAVGSAIVNAASGRSGVVTILDASNNSTPTRNILIGTGDKTAGTGDSGSINLVTGTSVGGTRGSIIINAPNVVIRTGQELRFNNPANTFHTSLKAGSNVANLSLTLPLADGTSGQVLSTDGAGATSFISIPTSTNPLLTNTALADSNATLTGAEMYGGLFTITPSLARTLTTDTAVNILAAFPGIQDNNHYSMIITCFLFANASHDVTLVAGSGVTIVGKAIINDGATTWLVRRLTSTTVSVTRTDSSVGRFSNGSFASPSISFINATSTGIVSSGTGMTLVTAGAGRLAITNTSIQPSIPIQPSIQGTAAAPMYAFAANTTTGLYSHNTNTLGITTGGVQRMTISTTDTITTLPIRLPSGSASVPSMTFGGGGQVGIFLTSTNVLGIGTQGVSRATIQASGADFTIPVTSTSGDINLITSVALSDANATLTAAQLTSSRVFTITPTVARTLTTDTAVNIVAALTGNVVGSNTEFTIINNAAFDVTLAAGAGVTLVGRTVISNGSGAWKLRIDSASAVTIFNTSAQAPAAALGVTTLISATNASMTSTVTNEVIAGLTFAHATNNSANIIYRIKKGTLVRTGTMLVSTDGTNVAFNDTFVETVDSSVVFEAVVNGANINIRHTNTESGTMNISFEQKLFPV